MGSHVEQLKVEMIENKGSNIPQRVLKRKSSFQRAFFGGNIHAPTVKDGK